MKTKSAKAKGRALQNWVRDKIKHHFRLGEEDIRCALMGESGADVKVAPHIYFPYSIECKNQEKFKYIYDAYDQARSHGERFTTKSLEPVVFIKMNHKKPLAIMDADEFIAMLKWRDI